MAATRTIVLAVHTLHKQVLDQFEDQLLALGARLHATELSKGGNTVEVRDAIVQIGPNGEAGVILLCEQFGFLRLARRGGPNP